MTIKDIATAAVFSMSRGGTVTISATQSGTPSPDSPVPIRPGLVIRRDDDSELEVYEGALDLTTGILTVTATCKSISGDEYFGLNSATSTNARRFMGRLSTGANNWGWPECKSGAKPASSHFVRTSASTTATWGKFRISADQYIIFYDKDSAFANSTEVKAWMAEQVTAGTPVQVLYDLATEESIQLTSSEVSRVSAKLGRKRMIAALLHARKEF